MSRIQWDQEERRFEYGIDRGVLYLEDGTAAAWNGLTDLKETPANTIGNGVYVDGVKRYHLQTAPDFKATLSALTYPTEFERCDGTLELEAGFSVSNQPRQNFNLSYRTRHTSNGYKIHFIYTGTAAPSVKSWQTLSTSPEPSSFEWDISTVPIKSSDGIITAHVYIDSLEAWPSVIEAVEEVLYGTDSTPPTMPTIEELIAIFEANALFVVIDNGDGSWTATGPAENIQMLDSTTFQISIESAIYLDEVTYTLSTY